MPSDAHAPVAEVQAEAHVAAAAAIPEVISSLNLRFSIKDFFKAKNICLMKKLEHCPYFYDIIQSVPIIYDSDLSV